MHQLLPQSLEKLKNLLDFTQLPSAFKLIIHDKAFQRTSCFQQNISHHILLSLVIS